MSIRIIITSMLVINSVVGFVKIATFNSIYTKLKSYNDKLQYVDTFTQFLDNSYLNNINSYTVFLNNSKVVNKTSNYRLQEIIDYNSYLNMRLRK
jgi:hypothetical protein